MCGFIVKMGHHCNQLILQKFPRCPPISFPFLTHIYPYLSFPKVVGNGALAFDNLF